MDVRCVGVKIAKIIIKITVWISLLPGSNNNAAFYGFSAQRGGDCSAAFLQKDYKHALFIIVKFPYLYGFRIAGHPCDGGIILCAADRKGSDVTGEGADFVF